MYVVIALMAVAFGTAADILYYLGLRKPGHTPPNRWSWLIFSFSAYIEVATYQSVSGDWIKVISLITTPIACTCILFYVWKLKEDKWESWLDVVTDVFAVVTSFVAIVIWLIFHEEVWAHMLMVIAVPVSYLPIWRSHLKVRSQSGEYLPWMLWTIMDALSLVVIFGRLNEHVEVPYVCVEFVCHVFTWFLVSFRRSA